MNTQRISAAEFAARLEHTPDLCCIDVRTAAEFRALKLAGSRHLALDRIDAHSLSTAAAGTEGPVYLLCASGRRAEQALERLALAEHEHRCVLVEGGLDACKAEGIVLEQGKGVISLERQVRIAAGSLVLTGVLIGTLIHPAGLALSAFVGAGLVFAGISDWCGMALLLARMPWNR